MFKRLFWLVFGAGLGFGSSWWVTKSVRRTIEQWTPEGTVEAAGRGTRAIGQGIVDSIRTIREEVSYAEDEVRAQAAGVEPVDAPGDKDVLMGRDGVHYLPPERRRGIEPPSRRQLGTLSRHRY